MWIYSTYYYLVNLNRISLLPEGAALRYGGGRGSCEQAVNSLLLRITLLKSEQYRAESNALPSLYLPNGDMEPWQPGPPTLVRPSLGRQTLPHPVAQKFIQNSIIFS